MHMNSRPRGLAGRQTETVGDRDREDSIEKRES